MTFDTPQLIHRNIGALIDLLSYIYHHRLRKVSKLISYFFTRIPLCINIHQSSSVPAKSEPYITAEAPIDNALTILPEEPTHHRCNWYAHHNHN